jgi:hypothetical protein
VHVVIEQEMEATVLEEFKIRKVDAPIGLTMDDICKRLAKLRDQLAGGTPDILEDVKGMQSFGVHNRLKNQLTAAHKHLDAIEEAVGSVKRALG